MTKAISKRLPNKNILEFCGKPMCEHTFILEEELQKYFGFEIFLTTDSPIIKKVASKYNIKIIDDPWIVQPLPSDKMQWTHDQIGADKYIMLPVNYGHRNSEEIKKYITVWLNSKCHSMITCEIKNKSDFSCNGNIFMFDKTQIKNVPMWGEGSLCILEKTNFDIDTQEDFDKAKKYKELLCKKN